MGSICLPPLTFLDNQTLWQLDVDLSLGKVDINSKNTQVRLELRHRTPVDQMSRFNMLLICKTCFSPIIHRQVCCIIEGETHGGVTTRAATAAATTPPAARTQTTTSTTRRLESVYSSSPTNNVSNTRRIPTANSSLQPRTLSAVLLQALAARARTAVRLPTTRMTMASMSTRTTATNPRSGTQTSPPIPVITSSSLVTVPGRRSVPTVNTPVFRPPPSIVVASASTRIAIYTVSTKGERRG